MKFIIYIILMALSSNLLAVPVLEQKLRALVKIQSNEKNLYLHVSDKHGPVPAIASKEEIQKLIESLKPGDEVMIEGRIQQELAKDGDGQDIRSYLVIDSIHKVSLGELGRVDAQINDKTPLYSREVTQPYTPASIPVTAEVASALTMTTSLLLLENLSSGPDIDPQGRSQMRQAIFLSTGLMATIVFVYEQLKGKTKP